MENKTVLVDTESSDGIRMFDVEKETFYTPEQEKAWLKIIMNSTYTTHRYVDPSIGEFRYNHHRLSRFYNEDELKSVQKMGSMKLDEITKKIMERNKNES